MDAWSPNGCIQYAGSRSSLYLLDKNTTEECFFPLILSLNIQSIWIILGIWEILMDYARDVSSEWWMRLCEKTRLFNQRFP